MTYMDLLLSIIDLGIEVIKQIRSSVRGKVSVVSSHIKLPDFENWDVKKIAVVSNKTDKPLFDIQIVLWAHSKQPKVKIETDEQEKGHHESIGGININTDSFVVEGEKKGTLFELLQISYIPENSSRRLFISSKGTNEIKLEAIKFSTQPNSIARKGTEVAVPFTPPFDMTLKSISMTVV